MVLGKNMREVESKNWKKDYLTRLSGNLKTLKIFGFDVETSNNNQSFVCGSIVGKDYKKFYRDKEDMLKEFATNRIFRNSSICATNLHFDILSLFERDDFIQKFFFIEAHGCFILASCYVSYDSSDTNFYSRHDFKNDDIKKFYKITFMDTLAHFKGSVENMGKIINLSKLSFRRIGERPTSSDEWREIEEYNIRDAEISYSFMEWVQKNYNDIGCNMKCTIASTSMDLMRRKFLVDELKREDRDKILFGYKAFYGGRVENFKRGFWDASSQNLIRSYDVNSLYPYCMRTFKYPYPISYWKDKVSSEDVESFEGIANFTLKCPSDMNIPLVCTKKEKLFFPTGIVKGVYDHNTVRHAINLGYEIVESGKGLIYENVFSPFKEYIDTLYASRLKAKEFGDNRELIYKSLMNNHFGKYGYNYTNKIRVTGLQYFNPDDTIYKLNIKKKMVTTISGEDGKIPNYVIPILALYTTSYARTHMHKIFRKVGFDRTYYSDTDCIFTDKKLSTSSDLGDLKLEHEFDKLLLIKPKLYGGIDKLEKSLVRIKGLRGSISSFEEFFELVKMGKIIATRKQFIKLRGSFVRNLKVNSIVDSIKMIRLEDDKRIWTDDKFTLKPQNSIPYNFT